MTETFKSLHLSLVHICDNVHCGSGLAEARSVTAASEIFAKHRIYNTCGQIYH